MEDLVRKRIMEVFALERTNPSKFSKEDKKSKNDKEIIERELNTNELLQLEKTLLSHGRQ